MLTPYPYKYDNRRPYRVQQPQHPMAERELGVIMLKQTLENRLKNMMIMAISFKVIANGKWNIVKKLIL